MKCLRFVQQGMLLALIVLCLSGSSCDPKLPEAAKALALKESAEQLKAGMTSLSDSIEKVDLVGIKGIMATDVELRDKINKLTGQLEAYGTADGVVEVSHNSRVYFEIIGYRGALTVDAWVDSEAPDNMFLRSVDLVSQTGKYPGVSYNIASNLVEQQGKKSLAARTGQPLGDWAMLVGNAASSQDFTSAMGYTVRTNIDNQYHETVDAAFDALLKDAFSLPVPDSHAAGPQAIDVRFLQGGRHRIFIRLTPQENDKTGHWAFAVRTYIEHPIDGKQEQVDLLSMNDRDYPNALKKKLNPVQAAGFMVNIPKADPGERSKGR